LQADANTARENGTIRKPGKSSKCGWPTHDINHYIANHDDYKSAANHKPCD